MGMTAIHYVDDDVVIHPAVADAARDIVRRTCVDADDILTMLGLA